MVDSVVNQPSGLSFAFGNAGSATTSTHVAAPTAVLPSLLMSFPTPPQSISTSLSSPGVSLPQPSLRRVDSKSVPFLRGVSLFDASSLTSQGPPTSLLSSATPFRQASVGVCAVECARSHMALVLRNRSLLVVLDAVPPHANLSDADRAALRDTLAPDVPLFRLASVQAHAEASSARLSAVLTSLHEPHPISTVMFLGGGGESEGSEGEVERLIVIQQDSTLYAWQWFPKDFLWESLEKIQMTPINSSLGVGWDPVNKALVWYERNMLWSRKVSFPECIHQKGQPRGKSSLTGSLGVLAPQQLVSVPEIVLPLVFCSSGVWLISKVKIHFWSFTQQMLATHITDSKPSVQPMLVRDPDPLPQASSGNAFNYCFAHLHGITQELVVINSMGNIFSHNAVVSQSTRSQGSSAANASLVKITQKSLGIIPKLFPNFPSSVTGFATSRHALLLFYGPNVAVYDIRTASLISECTLPGQSEDWSGSGIWGYKQDFLGGRGGAWNKNVLLDICPPAPRLHAEVLSQNHSTGTKAIQLLDEWGMASWSAKLALERAIQVNPNGSFKDAEALKEVTKRSQNPAISVCHVTDSNGKEFVQSEIAQFLQRYQRDISGSEDTTSLPETFTPLNNKLVPTFQKFLDSLTNSTPAQESTLPTLQPLLSEIPPEKVLQLDWASMHMHATQNEKLLLGKLVEALDMQSYFEKMESLLGTPTSGPWQFAEPIIFETIHPALLNQEPQFPSGSTSQNSSCLPLFEIMCGLLFSVCPNFLFHFVSSVHRASLQMNAMNFGASMEAQTAPQQQHKQRALGVLPPLSATSSPDQATAVATLMLMAPQTTVPTQSLWATDEERLAAAEILARASLWDRALAILDVPSCAGVTEQREEEGLESELGAGTSVGESCSTSNASKSQAAYIQTFNMLLNLCLDLKAYAEIPKLLERAPEDFNVLDLLFILSQHFCASAPTATPATAPTPTPTASTTPPPPSPLPPALTPVVVPTSASATASVEGDMVPLAMFQEFLYKLALK
ncbi:hypothetical protein Pelo_12147 [Pelomyxa schiedti]|nr:hypothetical protein Pelo_12147 [Pelomyxa schiedti]